MTTVKVKISFCVIHQYHNVWRKKNTLFYTVDLLFANKRIIYHVFFNKKMLRYCVEIDALGQHTFDIFITSTKSCRLINLGVCTFCLGKYVFTNGGK